MVLVFLPLRGSLGRIWKRPLGRMALCHLFTLSPLKLESIFSKPEESPIFMEELIKNADFKYIFLSYNNEGLMSVDDVRNIMSKYGIYDLQTKEYQRFKADKSENRNHKANRTFEYLHILEKR
jgi:adenine-specific DNA methylase